MRFILPTLLLALVSGCATGNPKAYSLADQPASLLTKEVDGVRVSVDAVLDSHRSHEYFGTDALGTGVVPVFVNVENLTQPGSILVEKEQFKITINAAADENAPLPGDVKYKSTTGEVVGVVGAVAVASPLILVSAMMISSADQVRHNFVDKEFRNQSLSPGRSAQGFVYCQMPDHGQPVHNVKILIPLRNLKTDQTTVCEFLIQK